MIRKISGTLVASGPVVYDGPQNRAEPAAFYDYIRVEDRGGQEVYLEQVIVPAYLDSLINMGMVATLYVAEVRIPTLFGSKSMHWVYALESGGKVRKAIEQTQRCFRGAKMSVLKLFLYGLGLMVFYGFGLLLWIQAVRLLSADLPLDAMRREPG